MIKATLYISLRLKPCLQNHFSNQDGVATYRPRSAAQFTAPAAFTD